MIAGKKTFSIGSSDRVTITSLVPTLLQSCLSNETKQVKLLYSKNEVNFNREGKLDTVICVPLSNLFEGSNSSGKGKHKSIFKGLRLTPRSSSIVFSDCCLVRLAWKR